MKFPEGKNKCFVSSILSVGIDLSEESSLLMRWLSTNH